MIWRGPNSPILELPPTRSVKHGLDCAETGRRTASRCGARVSSLVAAVLIWAALLVAPTAAAESTPDPGVDALADLEYKREVLMYCGISDPDAVRGFLDRQSALVERYSLNREMLLDAASTARQRAYAEWQNRGLGGFRGWCRNEGSEYAAILRGYVIDSD